MYVKFLQEFLYTMIFKLTTNEDSHYIHFQQRSVETCVHLQVSENDHYSISTNYTQTTTQTKCSFLFCCCPGFLSPLTQVHNPSTLAKILSRLSKLSSLYAGYSPTGAMRFSGEWSDSYRLERDSVFWVGEMFSESWSMSCSCLRTTKRAPTFWSSRQLMLKRVTLGLSARMLRWICEQTPIHPWKTERLLNLSDSCRKSTYTWHQQGELPPLNQLEFEFLV